MIKKAVLPGHLATNCAAPLPATVLPGLHLPGETRAELCDPDANSGSRLWVDQRTVQVKQGQSERVLRSRVVYHRVEARGDFPLHSVNRRTVVFAAEMADPATNVSAPAAAISAILSTLRLHRFPGGWAA